jgi:hypothetical protein
MQTVIEFALFFQFKKFRKIAADFSWLHIYPKPLIPGVSIILAQR